MYVMPIWQRVQTHVHQVFVKSGAFFAYVCLTSQTVNADTHTRYVQYRSKRDLEDVDDIMRNVFGDDEGAYSSDSEASGDEANPTVMMILWRV